MTVQELIIELQKYDENLIAVTESQDDSYSPCPHEEKYDFNYSYWEGSRLMSIPKGTKFIKL